MTAAQTLGQFCLELCKADPPVPGDKTPVIIRRRTPPVDIPLTRPAKPAHKLTHMHLLDAGRHERFHTHGGRRPKTSKGRNRGEGHVLGGARSAMGI